VALRMCGFLLIHSAPEENQPQLEMALHASSCTVVVKHEHEKYLSNLVNAFKNNFNRFRLSNKQKQELKQKFDKGTKIALSTATQVLEKVNIDSFSAVEQVLKTYVYYIIHVIVHVIIHAIIHVIIHHQHSTINHRSSIIVVASLCTDEHT
jgi:restriction endonuclease